MVSTSGGSQVPGILTPGDLKASCDLCRHLHTCVHTGYTYTHTYKNKINLKKGKEELGSDGLQRNLVSKG